MRGRCHSLSSSGSAGMILVSISDADRCLRSSLGLGCSNKELALESLANVAAQDLAAHVARGHLLVGVLLEHMLARVPGHSCTPHTRQR
ncbi:hypothetical protein V5799_014036, partial [Amblyomma americanum]